MSVYTFVFFLLLVFTKNAYHTFYMLPRGIENIAKGTTAINMQQILLLEFMLCMKYEFIIFGALHQIICSPLKLVFLRKMQKN